MTQTTDYYLLLGVPETASSAEIKRAYRALARDSHPDHNPGDPAAEERFKAIQRAYQVLSDPVHRTAYDATHHDWSGAGSPDPLVSLFFDHAPPAPAHSVDIEARVRLTFDQALRGGRTEVRLVGGETVRLTVPKGVRSGLKVRVRGCGHPTADGRGDLYVTFRVDPSPRYRREGDNLHVVETISAIEAMIGTSRSITNAYGQTVKASIPPGTQPGERLRLRGQGIETASRRGDLFVEVQVTVPRSLTDEQRTALADAARDIGLL